MIRRWSAPPSLLSSSVRGSSEISARYEYGDWDPAREERRNPRALRDSLASGYLYLQYSQGRAVLWISQEREAHAEPRGSRGFSGGLVSFDFDELAAEHYARIRSETEMDGKPIGSMDLLIAAIALAHGLILVTHNMREFSRVRELRLEDWEAP